MTTVLILSSGFHSQNSRGFLHPILANFSLIRANGVHVSIDQFRDDPKCPRDVLMVDSKAVDHLVTESDEQTLVGWLEKQRRYFKRILFVDLTDSAGWLMSSVLPYVDRYYKGQLLTDRTNYCRPMYGRRLYTQYYHATVGLKDSRPVSQIPVADDKDLSKLAVHWNSSLTNYAPWGPRLIDWLGRTGLLPYLNPPNRTVAARSQREQDITCRLTTEYGRETVSYQRRRVVDLLASRIGSERVNKRQYYAELRNAKIAPSPYGWGEINQKDYEVFLAGTLLLKPDMNHVETWPNLFIPFKTYVPFRWDLSDLLPLTEQYLKDEDERFEIAEQGQRRYVTALEDSSGFVERFCSIVRGET